MNKQNKMIFKSFFKAIKQAKHRILLTISCFLLAVNVFIFFANFNYDKYNTNKLYSNFETILATIHFTNDLDKRENEYPFLNKFSKINRLNILYDNDENKFISYNPQIGKYFNLPNDFEILPIQDDDTNKYFAIAVSENYAKKIYPYFSDNPTKSLKVGDSIELIKNKEKSYHLYIKYIYDTKINNYIDDKLFIIGNNFLKQVSEETGFYNQNISNKLNRIINEYDSLAYKRAYSIIKKNNLNFTDKTKDIYHSLYLGTFPKNKNEIMLPKEPFYELLKEDFNNKSLNYTVENDSYFNELTITGFYETHLKNNNTTKYTSSIIINDEQYDSIYYDYILNPYTKNKYYLGDNSSYQDLLNYFKVNTISDLELAGCDFYDDGTIFDIDNVFSTINTISMFITLITIIIIIISLINIISFWKTYENLNKKNIAKLIVSGIPKSKIILLSSCAISIYFLIPFLIGLIFSINLNTIITKTIIALSTSHKFSIQYNYLNIYIYTFMFVLPIILILIATNIIKINYSKKEIGKVFK